MTVSVTRQLLFLVGSLCLGALAACVRCLPLLLLGNGGERSACLYGRFPYPPFVGKGNEQKKKKSARLWHQVVRFLWDVAFFVMLGVSYCILAYAVHNGVLRLYSLIFLFLGFLGAWKGLSPLVSRLSRWVFRPLREGCVFCLLWVFYPLWLLSRGLCRFIFLVCRQIRAPFSHFCGILRKKAEEKRKARAERQREQERRRRRALGHSLTGAPLTPIAKGAPRKGKQ